MTQEISKQVVYVLEGQTYSLAIPKQVDYVINSYPYQDISKQAIYPLMQNKLVQVSKQVVYAMLAERVTNFTRRTSSSSYTFKYSPN